MRRDGDGVALVVEDEGPGVPDELRGRVFERFVRGASDRGGSSGLGLSIVRAVAETHGGTVALETGLRARRALRRATSRRRPRAGRVGAHDRYLSALNRVGALALIRAEGRLAEPNPGVRRMKRVRTRPARVRPPVANAAAIPTLARVADQTTDSGHGVAAPSRIPTERSTNGLRSLTDRSN